MGAGPSCGWRGLGIFGASLFLGDSMITPAISVLSAVEGVKVAAPSLGHLVVPITVVIIIVLFTLQSLGTGAVGRLFGPVMIVWFITIGACGLNGISDHPEILKALSPSYAVEFLFGHFGIAFFALAAIVLAVTGAEALYADMGHFGRAPITRAWLFLVFPACTLSYLGQGALILANPRRIRSPFFLLAPHWGRWPIVILATAATVIASQAVITGAFSVAYQAVQLGYLPRLRITHTSDETVGQIYVPWINWLLMISVVTLVITFKSSTALAFAFGLAVTGTITITTLLFLYIARHQWGRPLWLVGIGGGFLLAFDLLFLAANLTKITHGAWLPLVIALIAFTVLTTWQRGRQIVTARRERDEGPLRQFIEELHEHKPPVQRVSGTAVFLNRNNLTAPLAMRACVDHLHALHEHVVLAHDRDAARPARAAGGSAPHRRPGLHRRRHHPRDRALRLHGRLRRAGGAPPRREGRDRMPAGGRRRVLLPLHDRSRAGRLPGDEPLAQATVPRHLADHGRRGGVLPPPARSHGDPGLAHRAVATLRLT